MSQVKPHAIKMEMALREDDIHTKKGRERGTDREKPRLI